MMCYVCKDSKVEYFSLFCNSQAVLGFGHLTFKLEEIRWMIFIFIFFHDLKFNLISSSPSVEDGQNHFSRLFLGISKVISHENLRLNKNGKTMLLNFVFCVNNIPKLPKVSAILLKLSKRVQNYSYL